MIRAEDSLDDIKRKVRIATILGTMQATLTDFKYLRDVWKKNTEEEALLGVSLTGIMDHPTLNGEGSSVEYDGDSRTITEHTTLQSGELREWLTEMKETAIEVNKDYAERLGINQSAAITCVKPSGTVSQLVDSASGIHPRFSKHYIRRVRGDVKDPLSQFLKDQGVPCEEDVFSPSNLVFSFPIEAPQDCVVVEDTGALKQLDLWLEYYRHWCEHKPSITIYYDSSNYLEVMQRIYNNFDEISGISLLPVLEHSYQQAPYEKIEKEEYDKLVEAFPNDVDWEKLREYELVDTTTGSQEMACVGTSCEIT